MLICNEKLKLMDKSLLANGRPRFLSAAKGKSINPAARPLEEFVHDAEIHAPIMLILMHEGSSLSL